MSGLQALEVESFLKKSPASVTRKGFRWNCLLAVSFLGLVFTIYERVALKSTPTDDLDHAKRPLGVSEFLEGIAQANSFCQNQAQENCVCKNPLEPSRPPKGTGYGDQWERAWKRNIDLASTAGNPMVVFLGDSITEHFLGTELAAIDPHEQGNAEVFQEFFGKQDNDLSGLALGIAGDRCNNVLFRIRNGEMPLNLSPRVFWILVGTNDLGEDSCSIESIVAGVLKVAREVRSQRPDATIVINSLLPRTIHPSGFLGTKFWPDIQAVNSLLESFILKMDDNIHWFNATDIFLSNTTNMNTQLMPDLLHPSEAGSRIWCREIERTIKLLIG